MTRIGLAIFAAVLGVTPGARAVATNAPPDFNEVFSLVRAHLTGATEAELNRMVVDGLLTALRGKVSLVGGGPQTAVKAVELVAKSSVLENDVAYLRVGRVDEPLAKELNTALTQLGATNKLVGLVLDLRFAEGEDYAAAAAVGDLFQTKVRPLLDWGHGVISSTAKAEAVKMPVAVLVNRESGGAAEALAGLLRETGVGLILGSQTAGGAMIGQEFPLKNGQRLRVAALPVKIGDGSALGPQGLKPDIEVAVSTADERLYLDQPYGPVARLKGAGDGGLSLTNQTSGTNAPVQRSRPSEAGLVRARREGLNLDGDLPEAPRAEPPKPVLRDPALARAVDLLKGLAVVRASRS